jgi:hypothetical protein
LIINPTAGPDVYSGDELLGHVRDSVERVTIAAETAHADEREQRLHVA